MPVAISRVKRRGSPLARDAPESRDCLLDPALREEFNGMRGEAQACLWQLLGIYLWHLFPEN